VLILGLGCGDCAFEVQKYYPRAEMIGVEIDKHVVDMAECYFNLATIKNLKIAIEDAAKYVRRLTKEKKPKEFYLIIVDIYLGKKIPKEFKNKRFFEELKKLLGKKGVIAYNHLFFKDHKKEAKMVIKELETIFPKIELQRTASNLIIFASNK
jgi:spermidine synthase